LLNPYSTFGTMDSGEAGGVTDSLGTLGEDGFIVDDGSERIAGSIGCYAYEDSIVDSGDVIDSGGEEEPVVDSGDRVYNNQRMSRFGTKTLCKFGTILNRFGSIIKNRKGIKK
jgi:hypothetical protein